MSRSIQVSVAPEKTDRIVDEPHRTDGIIGISLQRGASLKPPGDVLTVQVTNEGFKPVQRWLAGLQARAGRS